MRMRRNERGASALEFALVLPILLLILFGIVNFGLAFAQNIALNNAAREAARLGAVMGDPDSPTQCAVVSSRVGTEFADGTIAEDMSNLETPVVTVGGSACSGAPCEGSAEGDSVRVTVGYRSDFLVPMLIPGLDGVDLEGVGEFKCEWS